MSRVIVRSLCSGSGATTLCAHLCSALAADHQVLLLSTAVSPLDLLSLTNLLNAAPQNAHSCSTVAHKLDEKSFAPQLVNPRKNLLFLCNAAASPDLAARDLKSFLRALRSLEERFLIVVDDAAGLSFSLEQDLCADHDCLITNVVEPDTRSLSACALKEPKECECFLVNKLHLEFTAQNDLLELMLVLLGSDKLILPPIPFDECLINAAIAGTLLDDLHPSSEALRALRSAGLVILGKLSTTNQDVKRERERESWRFSC